jgi:drug/metabolite transporter (DMT)-like permease
MRISGWIGGGLAASLVGASVPVSEALVDYPYEAGQAIRYLGGAAILTVLLKGRLGRPTLKEFALLFGVAAVGMVIFNLAVLGTVERIGATNAGVVIGASPVVLALIVPLIARRTPNRQFVTAALIVVAGAALVNGTDDRINAIGLTLALTALAGEVGFTLLAAPLLPRLGPMRVAAWSCWIATAQLLVLSKGDLPAPATDELAAIAYLAILTTALAFVLWFKAVGQLGADKAGLLIGLMPVAAVVVDAGLNGRTPSPADVAGTALVASGVVLGARPARARLQARGGTPAASAASSAGTSSTCPAASSSPAAALPAPASHR